MKVPPYPRIAASSLAQYVLDRASEKHFERRFRPLELGVMGLVNVIGLLALLASRREMISVGVTFAIMAAAVVPGLVVMFRVQKARLLSRPVCLQSGREMEPHIVAEREQDDAVELAYIDREAGVYFTRVYSR